MKIVNHPLYGLLNEQEQELLLWHEEEQKTKHHEKSNKLLGIKESRY
jgi:hypothetical protein